MKNTLARLGGLLATALTPGIAAATLTVTPLTWNVIGLDSNTPAAGPKHFPVGARVCSDVATTNVSASWAWDSANPYISLRPGSLATLQFPSIAAGACVDAYFEVEVAQVAAAYDTTRRYRIIATDASGSASTPQSRELYVEHLISQSRNAVTGIKVDGVAVPPGGTVGLVLGNTYTIELAGGTATQGYNQFEAFVNFSNAIFQILSVQKTFSANNSPYVSNPSDKLYADACLWENNPASPNYRSCVGGDYKTGGSAITTVYTIRIIGGAGTSQALSTLLYDFSGSSYHYNADYAVGSFIAAIVDPTSLGFAKAFTPSPTVAGGTSVLTFTITNPNAAPVGGLAFNDNLPQLAGGQMVVASPASYSTSGCGTPTFVPAAGAASISFANGSVAANSTCTVSVRVSVPAAPTAGTYNNVSSPLFVGSASTGKTASASLGLAVASGGTPTCGVLMANWNFSSAPPAPAFKAADVTIAAATAGAGISATAIGGVWEARGFPTTNAIGATSYFQFAITTTNYNGIEFGVDTRRTTRGPTTAHLYYSTDGVNFAPVAASFAVGTAFETRNFSLPGSASTSGETVFRLYAYDAQDQGNNALFEVDNVLVRGCKTPQHPTIAKAFAPSAIAINGTSTLTFTLANPNPTPLTGVRFSDALPAGVQVAASPNASTTCGGSPTWAPAGGATTLDFGTPAGATIAASSSCTVTVSVTTTTAGPHVNVSGYVSSTESGTNIGSTGSATATLTGLTPPRIDKDFAPNPIAVGGTSILTITIVNPNLGDALTGVAFSDSYPAGLVNATPLLPAVVNTCGGLLTAAAGGSSIALSGAAVAAGSSCTIEVPVTAASTSSYVNVTSAVTAAGAGNGNSASATLTVNAPNPAIALAKRVSTSPTGPWLTFVTVAPGTPLYYQFTVENVGDVALNPFSVSDPTVPGASACIWQTTNDPSTLPSLPVASATVDPTATCVVGPVTAATGVVTNTATAQGSFGATVVTSDDASAEYAGAQPGFTLTKQVSTTDVGPWTSSTTVAVGADVFYRFTIVNTGALPLSSIGIDDPRVSTAGCSFVDPLLPGGASVCVVGPVTATGAPGETVPNTATAYGKNGTTTFTTPPSSANYVLDTLSADLSIAKTNNATGLTAGGSTTYTVTVTNNGPDEVASATVTDAAPAGLTFGAWTCAVTNPGSGGTVTTACGAASGSGNLATTATLKPGAVVTYTVAASVAAAASGTIANTATVTAPGSVTDPVPSNNSATDTDPVGVVADLSVTKTNNASQVTAGGATTYTIVAANAGPSNVAGATLADAFPPAIAVATWTAAGAGGATCPASGSGSINATMDLPVGGSCTFTVSATIAPGATGTLTNTASVAPPGGVTDPDPANNSATDSDPIAQPTADLSITKTDGVTNVTAGTTTTYTIVVANAGPDGATGASVVDTFPAGIASATWTCVGAGGGTCPPSGSGNLNVLVDLPAGASVTFTVAAAISSSASGSLTNTATVSVPVGYIDSNPANNSATDTDTIDPAATSADLSVTKTDGVTSVTAGASTTYTIVVANAGPDAAANVTLSDPLPAGTTFTSLSAPAGWSCTTPAVGANGTVSCSAASLPASGSASFTLVVAIGAGVPGGSSLTNTAATSSATPDLVTGNNSATDVDTVIALPLSADLAVTKSNGTSAVTSGASTSYTVTVTNNGPSAVTGAMLSDPPAAGLAKTAVACSPTPGQCTTPPSVAQIEAGFALPALAAGASYRLVVTATVTAAGGSVTNTATVAAPGGSVDPNPANNTASDTDPVMPAQLSADLVIVKTNNATSLTPGGSTVYTLVVTNNGPAEVTDAVVTDAAPAGLTFGAWTCVVTNPGSGGVVTTACGVAGGVGNVSATVTMKVGAAVTFTVPATVAVGFTGTIVNVGTVTPPPGVVDPSPGNESSTDVDPVVMDAAVVEVPTLSEWTLLLLSCLVGVVAAKSRRTTRRAG